MFKCLSVSFPLVKGSCFLAVVCRAVGISQVNPGFSVKYVTVWKSLGAEWTCLCQSRVAGCKCSAIDLENGEPFSPGAN